MAYIKIIAAIGKNYELGKNNKLIWHLKDDLKFFKECTINKKIVMGLNTFLSLPKTLNNRDYIVLADKDINIDNALVFNDFNSLKNYLDELDEEVYIIGGESIYKQFIKYAKELILTEIDEIDESADVYFPRFNKEDYEIKVIDELVDIDSQIKFRFVKYRRK